MVMSEEGRKEKIEAALKSHPADGERLHLPWKDGHDDFPVITLPLEAVVLNPRSHRIGAQVESHPKRELVDQDPFSDEAQEVVTEILRNTDGYEELKTNLSQDTQREAGVITRGGVLLNGNTRAAALRDLGKHYIRVAVLPGDAGDEELDELELRLQMRREFKQDYTFTNELLFVNDLLNKYKRSAKEIALALGWAAADEPSEIKKGLDRVQQSQQLLGLIREIQNLSEGRLPLTDFDDKRQALIEINAVYQETVVVDPGKAERIRDARIVGVLSDVTYRLLRHVDADFITDRLIPAMEAEEVLQPHISHLLTAATQEAGDDPTGLDVLGDAQVDGSQGVDVTPLLNLLTRSRGAENVDLPADGATVSRPREAVINSLHTAIENAAIEAEEDKKAGGKLLLPKKHLDEATKRIGRAAKIYEEVRGKEGFPEPEFRDAWEALKRAVAAFDEGVAGQGIGRS
jgi:hypothetical protein